MISQSELDGYRRAEELVLAAHHATHGFPREADPQLVERLRRIPCAATDSLLDGCASATAARRQRLWRQGLTLLEQAGEAIDQAADAGWLPVATTLTLLEIQSAAVLQLLALLEDCDTSRKCADPAQRAA
ncbi:MAG: hypothetical protein SX243_21385 [Acidobacteriota bacterium]|nr:hypothetical protein [Acidobacteriota bacterium]